MAAVEEEAVFRVETFQRGLPPAVEVRMPRAEGPKYRGWHVWPKVGEQLGVAHMKLIAIIDNDMNFTSPYALQPSGTYYAYVYQDEEQEKRSQKKRVLLAGVQWFATEGNDPAKADKFVGALLGGYKQDRDLIFSLYRLNLVTLPESHPSITACARSLELDQAMRQQTKQRLEKLSEWSTSEAAAPHETAGAPDLTLFEVLQTLPPPFTPIDIFPVESLVALSQTSLAWHCWLVCHQLPLLLPRLLSDPVLKPLSWSHNAEEVGGCCVEEVWTSCSLSIRTSEGSPTAPSGPAEDPAVPMPRCPLLLDWLIEEPHHMPRVDRSPLLTSTDALEGWEKGFYAVTPDRPDAAIRRLLMLLGCLSTASASSGITAKPSGDSHTFMMCFRVPSYLSKRVSAGTDDLTAGETDDGLEVLWKATWGSMVDSGPDPWD